MLTGLVTAAGVIVAIGALLLHRHVHEVQQRQRTQDVEDKELELLADVSNLLERYVTFNMRPIGGDDGRGFFLKSAEDARRRELYALVSDIDTLAHKFPRKAEARAVLRSWLFEQSALQKAWNGVKDTDGAIELQNRINAHLRQQRPG